MSRAKPPMPTSHQASAVSSLRSAKASGSLSPQGWGRRLSWVSHSPTPMSRWRAIRRAAVMSAAPVTADSARTAGAGCAKARACSVQSSGDSQPSHPAPLTVSPSTRRPKATASAAADSSTAPRRVPATWLATGAHPDEYESRRSHGEGQKRRRAHREPASHQGGPECRQDDGGLHAGRGQGGAEEAGAADGEGEHRLGAPAVFLAAQRAGGGQQPPDAGDDGEDRADAPGGVAADGQQVVGRAVEQPDRLVVAEAAGEPLAGGDGGVGVAVGGGLEVGDAREQRREGDRLPAVCGDLATAQTQQRRRQDGTSPRPVPASCPRPG